MHADIPAELRSIPHWVGWKYIPAANPKDKPRKVPANPRTGRAAKADDRATWDTFDAAIGAIEMYNLAGVGFMFTGDSGFTGIDFDDCIVDGKLAAEAEAAVRALNSYTEVSPSGGGVKVIVRGRKPAGVGCKVPGVLGCSRVEVYDSGRFFTVTGRRWPGTPATVEARQAEVTALCATFWPVKAAKSAPRATAGKPVVGRDNRVVRCRRYLEKCPNAISGEDGHDKAFRAACECYRFGLSDGDALAMLQWFNETKCEPVWNERELAHKLTDAKKKVVAAGDVGLRLRERRSAHSNGCAAVKLTGGKPVEEDKAPWHNPLPAWIRNLERPKLRPYPTAILQAIANRCDVVPIDAYGSLGYAIIGYEKLAKATGMGTRTAIGHVQRLVNMRLLVKVETGGGHNPRTGEVTANVYAIPGAEGIDVSREYAKPAYQHPQHWLTNGKQPLHTLARGRNATPCNAAGNGGPMTHSGGNSAGEATGGGNSGRGQVQ